MAIIELCPKCKEFTGALYTSDEGWLCFECIEKKLVLERKPKVNRLNFVNGGHLPE